MLTGGHIDPEVGALLTRLGELGLRPHAEVGLLRARHAIEAAGWMQRERIEMDEVRDLLVDGADGRLPARLYQPGPRRDLPVIVYLHGGGWVAGSVRGADSPCRELAAGSGCAVLSVGYRLAPETPFPGGLADCIAALSWVTAHGSELGADPQRLALVGASAGGNLAAAAAIATRTGGGSPITRHVLFYPVLAPPPGNPHRSYTDNGEGFLMTRADLEWFWEHYLPAGSTAPRRDGLTAAPLLAPDLSGMPATTVVTAGLDPLRDEGRAFVDALLAAGAQAELVEQPNLLHGFSGMTGSLTRAREVVGAVSARLGEQLRRG